MAGENNTPEGNLQAIRNSVATVATDPATQTTLAAILAKIIAAPATAANQTTANTSLAAILAKEPALGTAGTPSADVITTQLATSNLWNYAAASGGIVSSTSNVVLAAAGATGVRNFLETLTISHDALGGATEIVVKDGSTVIWRGRLQIAAVEDVSITFKPPLRGTAATALNLALITSVTGGVYVNASGFTGT